MGKYKVMFEIHIDRNKKEYKEIVVEAGNKRIASLRALNELWKQGGYDNVYKDIVSIEEVESAI